MKVSIVIPAYNAVETIRRSIDSVLNQSYSNIEVIVVNDGSLDDTETILKYYEMNDYRLKYINKSNGGVSSARNLGIKNATGDFICFLDCDDTYSPTYVDQMVKQLKSSKAEIVYCGYNIIKSQSDILIPKSTKFSNHKLLNNYLLGITSIQTACWMIRLSLLKDNDSLRFRDGVSWGEDVEFFSLVLKNVSSISFVSDYLVNYYIGYSEFQLSSFTIDQIDFDFDSNNRLLKDFNDRVEILNIISKFRIQSSIIFKLKEGIDQSIDLNVLKTYFNKYNVQLKKNYWNYGMKSFKLNLMKLYVTYLLK